jgi:hypothetical protein
MPPGEVAASVAALRRSAAHGAAETHRGVDAFRGVDIGLCDAGSAATE